MIDLKGKARIPTDDLMDPKTRSSRQTHSMAFQLLSDSKEAYKCSSPDYQGLE